MVQYVKLPSFVPPGSLVTFVVFILSLELYWSIQHTMNLAIMKNKNFFLISLETEKLSTK